MPVHVSNTTCSSSGGQNCIIVFFRLKERIV